IGKGGLAAGKNEFLVGRGVFSLVGHASAIPLADHRTALSQNAGQLPGAGGTCPLGWALSGGGIRRRWIRRGPQKHVESWGFERALLRSCQDAALEPRLILVVPICKGGCADLPQSRPRRAARRVA